ncbi:universal stress protein [Magnetospirillum fulvum]|uniref:Nucleotide-binding universal stress protein, UspA family n=1 Tax=Magnetospirillum fulvum TaxID=1082 RepID=A0A1H6HI94_MAGFU|nr:universal stress protein [Magnetospirillum fulvum]SEH33820.1 Nucleotide-binding universal stress protein, UspA family [Magnetospirillum fulvum]
MRDILVHLDGGARTAARCDVAMDLARRFGARVTALFCRTDRAVSSVLARKSSQYLLESADEARALFEFAAAEASVASRWWQVDHGDDDRILATVRLCSRYFDLVVVGQEDEDGVSPASLVDQAVQQSGRPVLIVPRVGAYRDLGNRIVVGWNAGREAAGVIHDGLPLLRAAQSVSLVTIHEKRDPTLRPVNAPPVDMVEHLSQWGVVATEIHLVRDNIRDMDLLLSHACDIGADLLAIGASVKSRSRARGSAADFILRHMPLPVFMSC